jgi:hypothetical protein
MPNQGNAQGPLKPVGSGFGAFLFWLVVAIVFPYEVLLPYWPEAVGWAPVLLYLLAFFNLLRAGLHVRRAVRLKRPNPSAGQMTQAKRPTAKAGTPAQTADRANRAEARAAKDDIRNAALPHIRRPPTVQRMR